VTESPSDRPLVVAPARRLDSSSAPDFETELLGRIEGGARTVLLDFSAVDYVSSAGLRVILLAGKRLKAIDGRLALCGLSEDCLEAFRISGFDALFVLYASVDEGLKA
jgi:anti-anti-sigma factor